MNVSDSSFFNTPNVLFLFLPVVLTTTIGPPLLITIVYRLVLFQKPLNRYHLGIVAMCISDFIAIPLVDALLLTDIFPNISGYFPFNIAPFTYDQLQNFAILILAVTSVHWKSVFKSSPKFDLIMYRLIIGVTLVVLMVQFARQFLASYLPNNEIFWKELSLFSICIFAIILFTINVICLISVRQLDSSKFTPNVLQGQRKMSQSLLMKSILLGILLFLGIFITVLANVMYATTDQNILDRLTKINFYSMCFGNFVYRTYPLSDAILTWWSVSGLLKKKKKASVTNHTKSTVSIVTVT